MIVIIKKPDFLGDSRWEFRHGSGSLPAKLLDPKWLIEFRTGLVVIHRETRSAPWCAPRRYGYDGDVIDLQYEVIRVDDVIHAIRPSQGGLFLKGE
jgi:hypothetical protein